MSARLVQCVDELRRRQWNDVAADVTPARHGYLKALDAARDDPHSYCVIENGNDYLCGARLTVRPDSAGLRSMLYGRAGGVAGRIGMYSGELVVCGWSPGHGRNVLVDRSLPEAEQVAMIERLCERMERFADGRTVLFPELLPDDELLAGVLLRRGYGVASGRPVAVLDVEWDDIAGYLAALKRRSRRANAGARLEINRFARSGAVVEPLGPEFEGWDEICELLNRHHERLNDHAADHRPARLRRLRDELGDDFIVYVSRQQGAITGACIAVRQGTDARLLSVGVDHAAAGDNFTYFNLAFYAPADHLARLGVRKVWLGNAAYEAKLRRGCRVVPSRVFVRPPTGLGRMLQRAGFLLQREWLRRKYRRFIDVAAP